MNNTAIFYVRVDKIKKEKSVEIYRVVRYLSYNEAVAVKRSLEGLLKVISNETYKVYIQHY